MTSSPSVPAELEHHLTPVPVPVPGLGHPDRKETT